ncbi:hypothetical protein M569_02755 [Genlisea aurea]|uniref:HP domain-containing protein n=1 Tax=Genlisea aurea TaxID=192259 RepID=S8D3M4_9LAMI|nr:hypothetical protein M569_02755 [Genlisea aurea]
MSISKKDLDPAFQGVGQKPGIEVWRIENFCPVPIPRELHGRFYTGDSYIILKTTALKSGILHHDIHYWLGKNTSQDEAGTAAIKTVELDAALGGCAVQYREVQGTETEKFLSYFKPCIIPMQGGVASGFKHAEEEKHQTRMYVCKGKHVVHVGEASLVPFSRSSLNHDDIFILDTESKIFQFNGSNSCIQERAKALEVVQYIKDSYHDGKCEIASIEDGKLMSDAATGEFWSLFGGFAPLPKKAIAGELKSNEISLNLYCVEKEVAVAVEIVSLAKELLETNKSYILDFGMEVFIWIGRNTSLEQRKKVCTSADELTKTRDRSTYHVIRVIEGHETVLFRSKFDSWPQPSNAIESVESGRGRVAALLRRQGVDVKGLVKTDSPKAEPQPYIDCTGDLQVWRVNGEEKTLLPDTDQFKFYGGDCYIFQYTYTGDAREEYLIGTWIGKQSVEEDCVGASSQSRKMIEAMKFIPAHTRIHEGYETLLFFAIFQTFISFKGGLCNGYKNYVLEEGVDDDTYNPDGLALFRVQGSGPENMQTIQVEPVASSLNSCYCYILHNESSIFTWFGSLTSPEDQELVERQLDIIKPNMQSRVLKEGAESEQFWELLGGKSEYSSQRILRAVESDPHLFSCSLSDNGICNVTEVYNFDQDDLMTEDVFILDCCSEIYVWVGQQVEADTKLNALSLGEKFVRTDVLLQKLSPLTPIHVVMEGSEPAFFTRFFTWDSTKSSIHGNSFQRKLMMLNNGETTNLDKHRRRRRPVPFHTRTSQDKAQRSRSVCVFSNNDRPKARGRSPAFNALASKFEITNTRNLSTPPPVVSKFFPRSASPDSAVSSLASSFEKTGPPGRSFLMPHSIKGNSAIRMDLPRGETKPETIQEEDAKEAGEEEEEDTDEEEGISTYPYERLVTTSSDPVETIDVTKREGYLSSQEFKDRFGMTKISFYKLPKWKQDKLKVSLNLF